MVSMKFELNRLTTMTTRPVEQALSMLLPTHATELPPELLNLAQSLVAQSRSYATSLKPEEEIARPYACAEMACKRFVTHFPIPYTLSAGQLVNCHLSL